MGTVHAGSGAYAAAHGDVAAIADTWAGLGEGFAMPEVTVGPIAHGGHVVAHVDGQTVFVRGALPGETVLVEITEKNSKISRGHVVQVIDPSSDRVHAPCQWAGVCGGCDFQHVELNAQRKLKSQVLADSFSRFAGFDVVGPLGETVAVNAVPEDVTGLGWRSRMRWSRGDKGWGLHAYRSHDVVSIDRCLIAVDSISTPPVAGTKGEQAWAAVGSDDAHVTITDHSHDKGSAVVRQDVHGRVWRMRPDSFWQVHVGAAGLLSDRVQALAQAEEGSFWWDLYSGVGLFAAVLGQSVGSSGGVEAVEESSQAQREARRAMHDLSWVSLRSSSVAPWLQGQDGAGLAGVVLDPPRAGAGKDVVDQLARVAAPRLVYVACDPVALARDVKLLVAHGYALDHIEAWDLFPMTHHFETIAVLSR